MKIKAEQFYCTSDIHLFHQNIISYCNRPWSNVNEMNRALIDNIKNKVPFGATLFILGDIAMGGKGKALEVAEMLKELSQQMELKVVLGNHDTYILEEPCKKYFEVLPLIAEVKVIDGNQSRDLVMCHFPLLSWHKMGKNSIMLHGHCHHSLEPDETCFRLDVGVDGPGYNYSPLSYAEIKKIMSTRTFKAVDHHDSKTSYY